MRKTIFIASFLLLAFLMTGDLSAQSSKRKTRSKATTRQPSVSPCGMPLPSLAEFAEETKLEWRKAGETEDSTAYYNTRKIVCDKETLKVWVKFVEKKTEKPLSYSMRRYEMNCRANQIRVMSVVEYTKSGAVLDSVNMTRPEWQDLIPDSIGEAIFETVCHKSLSW